MLQIVAQRKTHPTAEEVYSVARKHLPTISLATVYRNLHLLAEEGKLREVQFHSDVIRYDAMLEPHEHFYCRGCGSVVDLPASLSKTSISNLANELGANIEEYALDYYGFCKECRIDSH